MSKVNNHLLAIDKPLKKINELIHNGSNKKAVQEVDRLPKEIRGQTVFKALKALALIHMCKRKQAFDILDEIDPNDELDGATLETVTLCYKQSVDVDRIVKLFEAASRRKPNDERIMEELFMSYVRAFNFKKQKEVALQMYKNFPGQKRLHSFWAVMSLVMQSQTMTPQEASDKKVCLSLAEKMCERMMDDERNIEEIELYLTILRKQNKHEEEYKFLTGPICLRIQDPLSWFTRRRAYLCLDLKMYSRAFKHYFPTLIQEYPDQIEYYQGLFKSAFLLDTEAPSQQQPVVNTDQQSSATTQANTGTPVKSTSALAECFDIVEKQCALTMESVDQIKDQSKAKSQHSKNLSRSSSLNPNRRHLLRGPFMARVELFHTIISNENVLPKNIYNLCKSQFEFKFPSLNSLLLDYFQLFGRKNICFFDLDHMMKTYKIPTDDQEHLLASVSDWIRELEENQPEISAYDLFHLKLNRDMLNHNLTNYAILDSRESRLKLARKFIDTYDENRHLGKDSNKTEFLPVDHYCHLAINSIMTFAVDRDSMTDQTILSDSILTSLIVLTENAVTNSPTNHQLKLTLLKLYSFVGASKQCSKVLLTLDIKHFQIDTLGHLLNPVLYNTGNYTLSNQSLETCLESHIHSYRECFECLTNGYNHGRFSRIGEISGVFERLRDSLNASQCVLLKGIVSHLSASSMDESMTACHSFDVYGSLYRIFRCPHGAEIIKDNRDFRVLRSMHAETDELVLKRKVESFEDEKIWLKLRYFIIRSVYIQLEYFGNQNGQTKDKKNLVEELMHGKNELIEILPLLDAAIKSASSSSDKRYSYFEPESSPFRWKHIQLPSLIALVNPLVFLHDILDVDTKLQETYNSQLELVISDLVNQLASINSLIAMKQALLSLTITVEFISLAITSLVSMVHGGFASGNNSGGTQTASTGTVVSNKQPVGQPRPAPSKNKSIPHQMLAKTESQLLRLSNSIKSTDPKTLLVDKLGKLEDCLLSNQSHVALKTKSGVSVVPLLGVEVSSRYCQS